MPQFYAGSWIPSSMPSVSGISSRSLENPSTPLSAPDDWLFDALGSYRSTSGVNVNHQTALTYAAVWRAVNLISGDIAKLPLYTYKLLAGGGRQKDKKHPAYPLLLRKPNAQLLAFHVKKVMMAHALLVGNGYAFIERDGAARPLAIWPLNPIKTYPIRENGVAWYVTEETGGKPRKIPRENVFHIKGLSWEGQVGLLFITKARESIGLAMAMETFGSVYFRNNARPNLILKHPLKLDENTKRTLRESFERMHAQLENAHRTAILDGGLEAQAFEINGRNAQLIEQRQHQDRQVANWFSCPPHKLGDPTRTSFNSLEQENQSYLDECLDPWMVQIEEESWDKLLTEEEKAKDDHEFKFDRRALVRANMATRGAYYVQALQNGWMNRDEVREEEQLNPIPEGKGQDFLVPLNMGPAGAKPPEPEPEPPAKPKKGKKKDDDDEDDDRQRLLLAHRGLLTDAIRRMAKRLGTHARKAAKKPDAFVPWLDTVAEEHRQILTDMAGPAFAAIAVTLGHRQTRDRAFVDQLLGRFRGELLDVAGRVGASELSGAVEQSMQDWETVMPPVVADALFRKVDEPLRSTDDALEILKRMPAADPDKPDEIYVPMPVDESPPFTIDKDSLPDFKEKTVKIRELVATRSTLKRKRVEAFIKDPDTKGSLWNVGGGRPLDRPYVIEAKGKQYVYDGHHRLIARQLLGTAKTKVYYAKE